MAGNGICSAAFCESAALRGKPAQAFSGLNPLSFAALSSSPEGGALDICLSAQKALLSGELARERLRGFSLLKVGRSFLRSAALSQKAALQMPSPATTPPVKMG